MGYAGKWFILVLVCAYSCLSNGYLKMPGLFNQEGEASEHKQYSLRAKCTTSVWREGLLCPASKGAFELGEAIYLRTLEPSPLVVLLWELSMGVSGDSQPIRGVGGRW